MSEVDETSKQLTLSHIRLGVTLFDHDGNGPDWITVNDDVMGGVSTSTVSIDLEAQRLAFSGNLSVENNGGFASIRSRWTTYDLGLYDGIALRVRGDGNYYRFRIRTEDSGPEISYTALFETKANVWQEIYIPFSEMTPLYRGRIISGVGPLDPTSIRSFGLMLADGQQGQFLLEVDWIRAATVS
jgi:NADH dehydrogenase [ubiquinone] 1 alpha subcomplex assembly factor 1